MDPGDITTLFYQRSHFVTRLPVNRLYSPSHYWLLNQNGIWRIGLTRFATHLLGEIVDYGFDIQGQAAVKPGQVLGWIEGFKAVSDLVCVLEGRFERANPQLSPCPEAIDRDCYGEGWLYEASGNPLAECVDAQGYVDVLNATIDQLIAKQQSAE